MVQDTCVNLVAFMNMLVPLLITLMMYTGSIATSGILEPIILFMIQFVGNIIQNIINRLTIDLTILFHLEYFHIKNKPKGKKAISKKIIHPLFSYHLFLKFCFLSSLNILSYLPLQNYPLNPFEINLSKNLILYIV